MCPGNICSEASLTQKDFAGLFLCISVEVQENAKCEIQEKGRGKRGRLWHPWKPLTGETDRIATVPAPRPASRPQTPHSAVVLRVNPWGPSARGRDSDQHTPRLFKNLAKMWTDMLGITSNQENSEVCNGNRDTLELRIVPAASGQSHTPNTGIPRPGMCKAHRRGCCMETCDIFRRVTPLGAHVK